MLGFKGKTCGEKGKDFSLNSALNKLNGEKKRLNTVLVITGPTGAGKTKIALSLAKKVRTEIISADSRQIYKGMDIGTDKVSEDIRKEIPHHLIDVALPSEVFTVADFKERAEKIIEKLLEEGKLPLVCGGTGLYIKALTCGIFKGPGRDERLREKLKEKARKEGLSFLYRELKRIDPVAAERIHPHDEVRIIRALEVFYKTGMPISYHQQEKTFAPSWQVIKVGICWRDRKTLYQVIEKRVDRMVEKGLVGEVRRLLEEGYREDLPSMQAIGYRQMVKYIKGEISLEEAVRLIKRDTKRFAKRQFTWFRKEKDIIWLERENFSSVDDVAEKIVSILLEKAPETGKALLGP